MKMLRYKSFEPGNYFTVTWGKSELQEHSYLPIMVLECVLPRDFMSKNKAEGCLEIVPLSLDWRSIGLVLSPSLFFCDGTER